MFRTGNRWRAVNKDVPRYFCPAVHRPHTFSRPTSPTNSQPHVTRRLFYYTLRKHRGHKRTTRVPPERRELPPRPPVSDAVCSENALLFHRDKKFNVWIITSELIDRQRGRGTGGERGWSLRASFHWVTDLLSPPVSAERSAKEKKRERERGKKNRRKEGADFAV